MPDSNALFGFFGVVLAAMITSMVSLVMGNRQLKLQARENQRELEDTKRTLQGPANDDSDDGLVGRLRDLSARLDKAQEEGRAARRSMEVAELNARQAMAATEECQRREAKLMRRVERVSARNAAYVDVLARLYPGIVQPPDSLDLEEDEDEDDDHSDMP